MKKLYIHVSFILAGFIGTLVILDGFNPAMGFYRSEVTQIAIIALCVIMIANSVVYTIHRYIKRKNRRSKAKKGD